MAGRPFLNVALPATATAAVAVMSYLLYKKTYPADDCKPTKTSTTDKRSNPPVSPTKHIPSDPVPTYDITKPPAKPQTTPDSSPCESPPLAFNEADSSVTQRIFDINSDEEGNNNLWNLGITNQSDMISDQIDSSSYKTSMNVTSRGDVRKEGKDLNEATVTKNNGDEDKKTVMAAADTTTTSPEKLKSNENKSQLKENTGIKLSEMETSCGIKPGPNIPIPEPISVAETSKGQGVISDAEVVAAVLMQNAHSSSPQMPKTVENTSLLNLQLNETEYDNVGLIYEAVPQILPTLEQPNVESSILSACIPFATQSTAQNGSQIPIPTGAFDSATHSPSEEMLESPCVSNYSDIHSEESSDSGKGGSDINMPAVKAQSVVYEFELPQDLCGLLIGQQGSTIKFIKNKTLANIYLKRHHFNSRLKLCTVTGTQSEVDAALQMIRNKFPLSKYSAVTLSQVNLQMPAYDTFPLPDTMQLILPEGIMCDVYLSSLVSANHFFVQQTVHPTYPALSQLTTKMTKCYSKPGSPAVPIPVLPSAICAAPVLGGWYRAQVTQMLSDRECTVKYLDYGGYSDVQISSLRQIRGDFLVIPFQASECYLANVKPINEETGFSIEAHHLFEELAQGQILQAQVVGYSESGIPCVYLYRRQGVLTHFINRELVSRGVALWCDQ